MGLSAAVFQKEGEQAGLRNSCASASTFTGGGRLLCHVSVDI